MSLQNFGVMKGITVNRVTGNSKVYFENFGNAAPLNTFGINNDYAVDLVSNEIWIKQSGNWIRTGISNRVDALESGLRWLSGVKVFSGTLLETDLVGDTITFENSTVFTFTSGKRVALAQESKIYEYNGTDWIEWQPENNLRANDTFLSQNYLPDTNERERGLAIIQYDGANFIKLGDIDFETADSISFDTYSPSTVFSTAVYPIATDSVQRAIEKIHRIAQNFETQIGVPINTANLGTMTGETVGNARSVKQALQDIVDKTRFRNTVSNITANTVVDSIPVISARSVEWKIQVTLDSAPNTKYVSTIVANTNGSSVIWSERDILELNAVIPGLIINVVISGSNIELSVASGQAVNVTTTRYIIGQ